MNGKECFLLLYPKHTQVSGRLCAHTHMDTQSQEEQGANKRGAVAQIWSAPAGSNTAGLVLTVEIKRSGTLQRFDLVKGIGLSGALTLEGVSAAV